MLKPGITSRRSRTTPTSIFVPSQSGVGLTSHVEGVEGQGSRCQRWNYSSVKIGFHSKKIDPWSRCDGKRQGQMSEARGVQKYIRKVESFSKLKDTKELSIDFGGSFC